MASVRLELVYDPSGEAVAVVPARSPRPAGPPVSPEMSEALLVGGAAMTPHEAESPQ